MNTVERASSDLSVPPSLLEGALKGAHFKFRKIRVAKRSGGERVMIQPTAELKLILSWMDSQVLSKLPISLIATAFQPGTSIVKNAHTHSKSLYSVRIDLSNFFPSIKFHDLWQAIVNSRETLPHWVFGTDFEGTLRQACFDRFSRLPVGYLTSPRIANAVMFNLDVLLEKCCRMTLLVLDMLS